MIPWRKTSKRNDALLRGAETSFDVSASEQCCELSLSGRGICHMSFEQRKGVDAVVKKDLLAIDLAATGRNIKALREKRGISVKEMQAYFGFDAPQTIYGWQRGRCVPTLENLLALSRLLGVSVEDIIVLKG